MTSKSTEEIITEHENSGKYFKVDGLQTFALDYGEGEPILCIHGVPTSSFLYRKVLNELKNRGYRGISIDLPGLGFTDRPEDYDYSFMNLSNFTTLATRALDLEKFHLVVHDIGGPIGFALAAANKGKILSMTILNTWIDVVSFEKPLPMRPFEKPVLGEVELALLNHTTWPLMFKSMGLERNERITNEEIKAYVDILKKEDNGKAFLKIMKSFNNSEAFRDICYSAVQNVPYPIQAIWGIEDPALTYERYGKEIKEAAGLKKVHKLNAKHFLQEEKWEQIAENIEKLIKYSQL